MTELSSFWIMLKHMVLEGASPGSRLQTSRMAGPLLVGKGHFGGGEKFQKLFKRRPSLNRDQGYRVIPVFFNLLSSPEVNINRGPATELI